MNLYWKDITALLKMSLKHSPEELSRQLPDLANQIQLLCELELSQREKLIAYAETQDPMKSLSVTYLCRRAAAPSGHDTFHEQDDPSGPSSSWDNVIRVNEESSN